MKGNHTALWRLKDWWNGRCWRGKILWCYFREVIWTTELYLTTQPNFCAATQRCEEWGSAGADLNQWWWWGWTNAQSPPLQVGCLFMKRLQSSVFLTRNKGTSLAKLGIMFYQLSGDSVNSCKYMWKLIRLLTASTQTRALINSNATSNTTWVRDKYCDNITS